MTGERDTFVIEGGCWCEYGKRVGALRIMGHTVECTQARRGWAANNRHLSELSQQRKRDEEAGRQLREDAEKAIDEQTAR